MSKKAWIIWARMPRRRLLPFIVACAAGGWIATSAQALQVADTAPSIQQETPLTVDTAVVPRHGVWALTLGGLGVAMLLVRRRNVD